MSNVRPHRGTHLQIAAPNSNSLSAHKTFRLPDWKVDLLSKASIVLLDTSVWNRLADARTSAAVEVRDLAIELRQHGQAVFPLCDSTVWEVRKQDGASLARTVELMELLSENISFRSVGQLYDAEMQKFVEYLLSGQFAPLSISERFGPLLCHIGRSFALQPTDHDDLSVSKQISDTLAQKLTELSLSSLVSYLKRPELPKVSVVDARRDVATRRRTLAKGSIELARRIEAEYVGRTHVLPRLRFIATQLRPDQRTALHEKVLALPRSRRFQSAIEHILRFTPSMAASVEMETLGGLDVQRVGGENDFNDLSLAVYGLSYAHHFAAVDGWIASLLSLAREKQFPVFVQFAGSIDALGSIFEALQHSRSRSAA
jgi:hypothetical protein